VRGDEPLRIARLLRIEYALRECIARDVERSCARICTLTAFYRALRAHSPPGVFLDCPPPVPRASTPRPSLPLVAMPYALHASAFVLLWNSGFIGAEYGLPYAGALTLLFWRYLALWMLLATYVGVRRLPLRTAPGDAVHAVWTGVLAHAVWLGCALGAIEAGVPAGIVALIVALQPLVTGALSGLVAKEHTSARQWVGLATGFAGVALAVTARLNADDAAPMFAYLLPFGSVVAITIASLSQRVRARRGTALPMATLLLYQSVGSAVALSGPAIVLEGLATNWTPTFIAAIGWVTVVVSLGAYALMWQLIARVDATRVASLFYFGPPVTMVMAWIAFGDTVTLIDVIALLITAAGVLFVQWRPRASRRHSRHN